MAPSFNLVVHGFLQSATDRLRYYWLLSKVLPFDARAIVFLLATASATLRKALTLDRKASTRSFTMALLLRVVGAGA